MGSEQPGDRLSGHPSAHSFGRQQAIAVPIFAAAFLLYVLTLAPTVVSIFDDSLEFQLVIYKLGIPHPPGYPLYTLLGWLFTRLPIGDVAYRVNLMSAVFGALTVALVYLVNLEIGTRNQLSLDVALTEGAYHPWSQIVAAAIGTLALAISPVFWSQATVAEVYTLNAAFVGGILWLLVGSLGEMRRPLALAFLFGLSLTHHRTMLLLLPAILFYVWHRRSAPGTPEPNDTPRGRRAWSSAGLKLVAAIFAPLLLYLYIPLRGHVGSLDGTYTHTLAGFWQHIAASGYGVFFQNPFGTERGVDFYLSLFLTQFGPLGLMAGFVGLVVLIRRPVGKLCVIAFLTYLVFNLLYRVADIQVFFIPLFLIWAIWIGTAAGWMLAHLDHARRLQPALSLAVVLILLGQSGFLLADNISALDRSDDWGVYDYGLDIVSQPMEPGAVLVGILGEMTLVRYFQTTMGLRPELATVAADQETERLATVAYLLEEQKAVYLTRQLPGAAGRWSLSAVGPLVRVNAWPVLEAPAASRVIDAPVTPGFTLYGYSFSRPPGHAGPPPVRLELIWQPAAPIARDLKVSARLMAQDGEQLSQSDAVPVHFAYPTTAWRPGEFIRDVYDLALPSDLEPGEYIPLVILYDPAQGGVEIDRLELASIQLP